MSNDNLIQTRLRCDAAEAYRLLADEQERTISSVVREVLEKYLIRRKVIAPRE